MILDHQKRYAENRERFEALQRQKANLMLNPAARRQNQASSQLQVELEAKERELYQEASELAGSMDDRVKQAIVDYLNLVFGVGQETEDFWNTILLPYASHYFSYPFDDLQRSPKFLNAIFFAFTEHFGLKVGKLH